MQSPMVGHIESELKELYSLSSRIISSQEVEYDSSHDLKIDGKSVTAISIRSSLNEYLLTIEGSGEEMLMTLRSTAIPELYIQLPKPLYVSIGSAVSLEELC